MYYWRIEYVLLDVCLYVIDVCIINGSFNMLYELVVDVLL